MMPMEQHPARRAARLTAARKVAAFGALKIQGDPLATTLLADFNDTGELTMGYQAVVEQLAIEVGAQTVRTPEQVLVDRAMFCQAGAHPPAAPT